MLFETLYFSYPSLLYNAHNFFLIEIHENERIIQTLRWKKRKSKKKEILYIPKEKKNAKIKKKVI